MDKAQKDPYFPLGTPRGPQNELLRDVPPGSGLHLLSCLPRFLILGSKLQSEVAAYRFTEVGISSLIGK